MAYQLAYYAIAMLLAVSLYGIAYILYPIAELELANTHIERFLGHLQQLCHLRAYLPHSKGISMVAIVTILQRPTVYGDDIPLTQRLIIGDAMHHLGIRTHTECIREIIQPQETRLSPLRANVVLGQFI